MKVVRMVKKRVKGKIEKVEETVELRDDIARHQISIGAAKPTNESEAVLKKQQEALEKRRKASRTKAEAKAKTKAEGNPATSKVEE